MKPNFPGTACRQSGSFPPNLSFGWEFGPGLGLIEARLFGTVKTGRDFASRLDTNPTRVVQNAEFWFSVDDFVALMRPKARRIGG